MISCKDFGFALGRQTATKQANGIGGFGRMLGRALGGTPAPAAAASASAAAKPVAASVTKTLPPPQATIPGTAGGRVFGDTSGLLADNAKAIAANPHYKMPGTGPLKMAPSRAAGTPAVSAPRAPLPVPPPARGAGALAAPAAAAKTPVRPAVPVPPQRGAGPMAPPPKPAPANAALAMSPEDMAHMSQRWGDASSGGRAQMLGLNAQGRGANAPRSLPSDFSKLTSEQQQQALRSYRGGQ